VWQLIPRAGLGGYLLTIYVSETLNFLLSFRQLNRHAGLRLPFFRSVLSPLMAAMCAIVLPRLALGGGQPMVLMGCSLLLYYLLLRLLGSVTRRDLRWFWGIFRQK